MLTYLMFDNPALRGGDQYLWAFNAVYAVGLVLSVWLGFKAVRRPSPPSDSQDSIPTPTPEDTQSKVD